MEMLWLSACNFPDPTPPPAAKLLRCQVSQARWQKGMAAR